MADFKILDIFAQDGQLVARVAHYHPAAPAAVWFVEHYTWQGCEGLKRKRATNALGQLLQDDDSVAPTRLKQSERPERLDNVEQFLAAGRTWKLRPGPHMVEDSILIRIRGIHKERLLSGWPHGQADVLGRCRGSPDDTLGAPALLAHFRYMIGREYSL